MALYGPLTYSNTQASPDAQGVRPVLPGAFCICEPATFAAHSALLTPYRDTLPEHLQNTFAGDAAGLVTVTLHFPDFATAQEVMAQVNGPVSAPPADLPDQVPMERVLIVASRQGLLPLVAGFIASLPEPDRSDAQILFNHAPNFVVRSNFAMAFKAAVGLNDEQYAQLIAVAQHLAI